jgi:hypothetical protein
MNDLYRRANALYARLPSYLRFAVDEMEDSGLEPDEIPDGYDRLRDQDVPLGDKL